MKELKTYNELVDSFSKLPGVGMKSAQRMAFSVIEMREEDANEFAEAIRKAKTSIHKCPTCGLYCEGEQCEVCDNPKRDHSTCIVVSLPKDALSFEKLQYKGVYHVLGGLLSPTKGIGAEDISIAPLLQRIEKEGIREVILAMNPNLEGETTALFIARMLQGKNIKVTRLGYGLPMGANLEYADPLTLEKALEGRKSL